MCESYNYQYKTNFKCLMPTNIFGPNDNYDLMNCHFLPALIKKTHQLKFNNKKEIILWGNGKAKREVIYVDDIADAYTFYEKIKETVINIGSAKTIQLKSMLKNFESNLPNKKISIKYDLEKPNGTPRKVLDVSLAKKYGWKSKTKLNDAILKTYNHFLKNT